MLFFTVCRIVVAISLIVCQNAFSFCLLNDYWLIDWLVSTMGAVVTELLWECERTRISGDAAILLWRLKNGHHSWATVYIKLQKRPASIQNCSNTEWQEQLQRDCNGSRCAKSLQELYSPDGSTASSACASTIVATATKRNACCRYSYSSLFL